MKTRLYINGTLTERDDSDLLQMNYTREELSNPTIVKNSYSQKVTLTATATNEAIFRGFYRYDNTRTAEGFDPLVRAPFEIRNELNEILENGYAKLESVNRKGSQLISYTLTLYGGLGAFFYAMTYKTNGDKKTLADLAYPYNSQGQASYIEPNKFEFPLTASAVALAWLLLDEPIGSRNEYDVINFAPCYNGLPACKFSADKAVYKSGGGITSSIAGISLLERRDGVEYTPRPDANGCIMLNFSSKHTEQETQDLRAYLQRPVLNLRSFLKAMTDTRNTEGWKVTLSAKLTSESYAYLKNTWMTLPMFDRDTKNPETAKASDVLGGTKTPADYLIALAKSLGWVFDTDKTHREIKIMTRSEYYSGGGDAVDLTPIVDTQKEITLAPYLIEDKFYLFANDNYGEEAESYAEKFGRPYGSQTIDTAYGFNAETKKVLDGLALKGAAMVLEGSPNFKVWGANADPTSGSYQNYELKFAHTEQVTYQLYGVKDGDTLSLDMSPIADGYAPFGYNATRKGYDFVAKPQLHKADNKAESGEGVLLFYNGKKATPVYKQASFTIAEVTFHLSDDNAAMFTLNDGVPCWDVSPRGSGELYSLPMFSRLDDETMPGYSFDFGAPREVYDPDLDYDYDTPLYTNQWARYLQDRYSVDTRVLTCYVDLSAFRVDGSLMRRFWYYGGAWWVLNKISNYNYGYSRTTKCEFVKIQDKTAYTDGQTQ